MDNVKRSGHASDYLFVTERKEFHRRSGTHSILEFNRHQHEKLLKPSRPAPQVPIFTPALTPTSQAIPPIESSAI